MSLKKISIFLLIIGHVISFLKLLVLVFSYSQHLLEISLCCPFSVNLIFLESP